VALSHTPQIELQEFWKLFQADNTPGSTTKSPDALQTTGDKMQMNPIQTGNSSDEKQPSLAEPGTQRGKTKSKLAKPGTERGKVKSKGDWAAAVAGEPHDSWAAFNEGNMNSDFRYDNPLRMQVVELSKGPVRAHMGASAGEDTTQVSARL
jgi:hypothetical protein